MLGRLDLLFVELQKQEGLEAGSTGHTSCVFLPCTDHRQKQLPGIIRIFLYLIFRAFLILQSTVICKVGYIAPVLLGLVERVC